VAPWQQVGEKMSDGKRIAFFFSSSILFNIEKKEEREREPLTRMFDRTFTPRPSTLA
jgi:hypothetical protein